MNVIQMPEYIDAHNDPTLHIVLGVAIALTIIAVLVAMATAGHLERESKSACAQYMRDRGREKWWWAIPALLAVAAIAMTAVAIAEPLPKQPDVERYLSTQDGRIPVSTESHFSGWTIVYADTGNDVDFDALARDTMDDAITSYWDVDIVDSSALPEYTADQAKGGHYAMIGGTYPVLLHIDGDALNTWCRIGIQPRDGHTANITADCNGVEPPVR